MKEGDRISFYSKSILFVPSELNKMSKIKKYLETNFSYQFYIAKKMTDWNGVFLDLKARDHIGPGSTVRIQFKEKSFSHGFIFYTYILEKKGKYLYGEILDLYIVEEEKVKQPVKIGCILKFTKNSITEIPISWNEHLPKLNKYRNRENWGYTITGYRSDDNYVDLE